MKLAKAVLIALALVGLSSGAQAQTCPTTNSSPAFTTGGSVFGRIAAQWNTYFSSKADANNGVLCNPTIIGGSQPGAFTVGPGLANTQGARNAGSNTIGAGATLWRQMWPIQKSSSYIVNTGLGGTSDSGAVLIAAGSGVTFTLPNPSSATRGITYQFGSDGTHGFSLATPGATALFYGCPGPGAGAASYTFGVGLQVSVVDDGANYSCAASAAIYTCGTSDVGLINCAQTWGLAQRGKQVSVALSTSTFTIDLNTSQHFALALNHSSCPCTIANPSNLASGPGQLGVIRIVQSASGNDGVTWGSDWKFAGGNPPVLSTGANAVDYLSYYVQDATHIVVALGVLNAQ